MGVEAHALKEARMPHHRARSHRAGRLGGRASCCRGWRDVRPGGRLGERLEVDGLWSGCGAGGGRARRSAASLACLAEALQPPAPLAGAGAGRGGARICELRQRTGWSPRRLAEPEVGRPHSTVHQVLRRGGCSRRRGPSARRSSATSGRARASCCTWTSRSSASFERARPRRHRRPHPALAAGRAGSTCTRSSTTARGWPTRDPRRRAGRHRHRLHRAARSTGSSTTASSPSG